MALPELMVDGVDIVVRGRFNPAIFSPAWLLNQGIIGATEYEAAEVLLITRDVAAFSTGWLRCQVTPDALQLSTLEVDEFERARDAADSVLLALPHTPVSALGINRAVHFVVDTFEKYHDLGDAIVPKKMWEDVLLAPGTRSVILWGVRPDQYAGRVQVQVEPSFQVPAAVFVSVNDHYELRYAQDDRDPRSREAAWQIAWQTTDQALEAEVDKLRVALEVLRESWIPSLLRSDEVIERVSQRVEAQE